MVPQLLPERGLPGGCLMWWLRVLIVVLAVGWTTPVWAGDKDDLGGQVKQILAKYCYRCHGQNGANEGGFSKVLEFPKLGGKVRPGDPKKSRLYKRMGINRDMPPEDEKLRPRDDEITLVEKWIQAGAPAPVEAKVKQLRSRMEEVPAHANLRSYPASAAS